MNKKQLIEGKFCCLDISDCLIDSKRAEELVEYFDDIYPKVADLLNTSNFPNKIYIFTKKDDCPAQKFDCDKIKFTPNPRNQSYISDGNIGFLIHEAVHIIQNYTTPVYKQNWWVSEAMADYIRARLGWDNFDQPNEYPCEQHNDLECSKCAAAFLFWLEKTYSCPSLVSDINKALQDGENIDNYFYKTLAKNTDILYKEYIKFRQTT